MHQYFFKLLMEAVRNSGVKMSWLEKIMKLYDKASIAAVIREEKLEGIRLRRKAVEAKLTLQIEALPADEALLLLERETSSEADLIVAASNTPVSPEIGVAYDESERSFIQAALHNDIMDKLNRQANREEVSLLAAQKALDREDPPGVLEGDFAKDFFRRVEELPSDDMVKSFWAEMLVEELARPARFFSTRTMDILKQLSADEIQLFNYYGQFCVAEGIILCIREGRGSGFPTGEHSDYGITLSGLLKLEQAGLAHAPGQMIERWLNLPGNIISLGGRKYELSFSKSKKIHGIALTQAGDQLLTLVSPAYNGAFTRDALAYFEKLTGHPPLAL